MPLVQVRNVDKAFHRDSEEITVFQGLDIDIEEREFLALMGPSGSGKSTLLSMLAGLDQPTRGSIEIAGENIAAMNRRQLAQWRAANVGFIFQLYNLIPVLTAAQNVELPLLLTRLSRRERRERALTALKVVGLEERVSHFPRQPSGGQEQRETRSHERAHVTQFERWGVLVLVLYPLAGLLAWMRGGHPYRDNRFECEARAAVEDARCVAERPAAARFQSGGR